jgi:hypothetical protein
MANLNKSLTARIAPVVLGSSLSTSVAEAVAGTVAAVSVVPDATITGANTNTRKYELINKGQTGAGSTVVASIQFDSGVNAPGFDSKALTLSATPANLVVADGDVLALVSTSVGTGIADPGALVKVSVSRS